MDGLDEDNLFMNLNPLNKYFKESNNKTKLLILLSALALLIILSIALLVPFKDKLLSRLYPKPKSQAATTIGIQPDERFGLSQAPSSQICSTPSGSSLNCKGDSLVPFGLNLVTLGLNANAPIFSYSTTSGAGNIRTITPCNSDGTGEIGCVQKSSITDDSDEVGVYKEAEFTDYIKLHPGFYWTIFNEPENPAMTYWYTSPEQYAKIYNKYYQILKNVFKDTTFAPAPTRPSGFKMFFAGMNATVGTPTRYTEYITQVLQAYKSKFGVSMPVDAWTIHVYPSISGTCEIETEYQNGLTGSEDLVTNFINFVHTIDNNTYANIPVWLTEFGWFANHSGYTDSKGAYIPPTSSTKNTPLVNTSCVAKYIKDFTTFLKTKDNSTDLLQKWFYFPNKEWPIGADLGNPNCKYSDGSSCRYWTSWPDNDYLSFDLSGNIDPNGIIDSTLTSQYGGTGTDKKYIIKESAKDWAPWSGYLYDRSAYSVNEGPVILTDAARMYVCMALSSCVESLNNFSLQEAMRTNNVLDSKIQANTLIAENTTQESIQWLGPSTADITYRLSGTIDYTPNASSGSRLALIEAEIYTPDNDNTIGPWPGWSYVNTSAAIGVGNLDIDSNKHKIKSGSVIFTLPANRKVAITLKAQNATASFRDVNLTADPMVGFLSGATSLVVSQPATYRAFLQGSGINTPTSLSLIVKKVDVSGAIDSGTEIQRCNNSAKAKQINCQINWAPQQVGKYYLTIQGVSDKGVCYGKLTDPTLPIPAGISCGDKDSLTVNVTLK